MRVNGHNVLAILASAVAMYAIGFVIYGVVFEQQWQQLSGVTEDSFKGLEYRMAFSPVMPILMSIGLSLVIKWRDAPGLMGGATTGFLMALFFVFATNMYTFVYGVHPAALLGIDGLHLFLINIVGGAVIGAWK
jgi:Protein of unknown function (DUF1761)